jgi:hypothetical protein
MIEDGPKESCSLVTTLSRELALDMCGSDPWVALRLDGELGNNNGGQSPAYSQRRLATRAILTTPVACEGLGCMADLS